MVCLVSALLHTRSALKSPFLLPVPTVAEWRPAVLLARERELMACGFLSTASLTSLCIPVLLPSSSPPAGCVYYTLWQVFCGLHQGRSAACSHTLTASSRPPPRGGRNVHADLPHHAIEFVSRNHYHALAFTPQCHVEECDQSGEEHQMIRL